MSNKKQKFDLWTKYRFPIVYVSVLLFLLLYYVFEVSQVSFTFRVLPPVKINPNEGFVIKTAGCRIPSLHPFDKSVLPYIRKQKHFICDKRPPLISSNLTSIFLEVDALEHYVNDFVDPTELKCCYRTFWRTNPNQPSTPDTTYCYGSCEPFYNAANINSEYVKVTCEYNSTIIYTDFHSFVTEKRKDEVFPRKNNEEKLNFLAIGLDAISRLNLHRQMPQTVKYLKEQLNAFELTGYNKVGDNTFPNLIPLLTGLSELELKGQCWFTTASRFDKCPFIWKRFHEAGYLTSFAEDSAWMGIFNYQKMGFQYQPTDYFWTTFNYLAEKSIGHSKMYNADLCLGSRPTYLVFLQYIHKFVEKMENKPFFAFYWGNSLSHDNLNFPSMGDTNYKVFFEKLKSTGILEKTVLMVLSDHGIRWGGIRSTHQGQLEERLPFLFFVFPTWFQKKYSLALSNLGRNTRRLTTPYDIHETLLDILNLSSITSKNLKLQPPSQSRGISLFSPVPENRTCEMAAIAQHWCTCQRSVPVDTNDTNVLNAANYTVDYMNNLLEGHAECATLHLNKILDARLLQTEDYLKNNSTIQDYIIIIETVPGKGLFEATVRSNMNQFYNGSSPFNLTGTVSRINLYGKQSACISNFHLKLYCYCG